ncbi:MAG TPA: FtsK/SpoIIIE domain-containing protein, partial [Marmoricola sp.]|nr:FtsK/SpoIIIE domain-containing protein [Marmoricola sp.]
MQTLVVSMAASSSPDWLNFLLIDYKGDSAFGGCVDLPHVVGKVNDLNPALVERSLVSLRAELDLRKGLFARAGAKDIDDYQARAQANPEISPLSRLVIVIDEFAELARELPDFVEGLVSVAQLGRSLGVHLILATQRPSGVVSPAIRANTNIRIALRVMDDVDSSDVVGVVDAARIPSSLPGRALLRLGGGPAVPFQTARVTGVGAASDPSLRVTSMEWHTLGRAVPAPEAVEDLRGPSDLATMVEQIARASDGAATPRRPWLDPLPTRLLWSGRGLVEGDGLVLPFGLSDRPHHQRQDLAALDLAQQGHLFFIGAPRSGRSQALRTIAASVAELSNVGDVHLYGLDCGTGALSPITGLPHCGAVVGRHETARAGRLLARLVSELEARGARLGREGVTDISEQRRHSSDPMAHVLVMLDGWDGFMATLGQMPEHLEAVMTLLREGSSVGIHLLITGDRSLITNARLSSAVEHRYIFRLAEKSDYGLAGLRSKQVPNALPPGRCYGPDGVETQIYLLDADASGRAQGEVLRHLGEIARRRCQPMSAAQPFRIDALPSRLVLADALALAPPRSTALPIVG